MEENVSYIDDLTLVKSNHEKQKEDPITFTLRFGLKGLIRNQLTQKNWEKAYNKHDNSLRITTNLNVKVNGRVIDTIKLVRKAIFFWTRNPKIDHRIWVMIVKDENPFYPLEEEEARKLLFDFEKEIEIERKYFKKGKNDIIISVKLSWGKHDFIDKQSIEKELKIEDTELV
ncbi:hypothetical protein [Candidatus Nitrosocosmicus franklandus]|uniref:Uncharacterized protein n=1 Tax=Candidatus Nitrosocosmicus franklandianus TaxID=1798806 RepID=A0A484I7Q1_9ARCH|nr:hypothetical protein [Candidatus Nitrosocosmicus franklandus]VFJ13211.1 conserved protein of unknown function [Candidatus Nitrosocosmicus franklandus]